ncbi:MAG: hypothetical protein P9L94_12495 [Candidatus Hinthialibacter antarcticus]|nr:hypothetical protein [Candidatus Hinthialibacter antarcticus]
MYWIYKPISGSFSAKVTLAWDDDNAIRTNAVNDWRKAGIMVRVDPEAGGSPQVFALLRSDFGADLANRPTADAESVSVGLQGKGAGETDTIILQRVLNTFSMLRVQSDGSFRTVGSYELDLPADLSIGLAVTSHDVNNIEIGKFSAFQIDEIPVGVVGSRTLPSENFAAGSPVSGVKIDVTVESGKTADLVVKETVPEGWTLPLQAQRELKAVM